MKITADVKPGEAQRHLSQSPMMSFFQDSLVILTHRPPPHPHTLQFLLEHGWSSHKPVRADTAVKSRIFCLFWECVSMKHAFTLDKWLTCVLTGRCSGCIFILWLRKTHVSEQSPVLLLLFSPWIHDWTGCVWTGQAANQRGRLVCGGAGLAVTFESL